MIEHRAAAASDVGRVRAGNEDSFHRGDALFAVADGMGGHVAGEVASRTALEPVSELDGKVYPDGHAAVEALRDAVVEANVTVAEKARAEPDYRGMGTTLTAAMLEGRRLHFAHVGDSRAYLMRDGEFTQITTDHTLVQHLIDEGQITPEEASTHPQRSIITRAIGVGLEVEVDTMTLDVEPGDEVLLCSDGLTGVVPDAVIASTLRDHVDPHRAVSVLIDLANEAGGPDNITIVLIRFAPEDGFPPLPTSTDDDAAGGHRSDDGEEHGDGRAPGRTVIRSGDEASSDGWAQKLGRLGGGAGADRDDEPSGPSLSRRAIAAIAVIALLVLGTIGGGRWLLSRSFYVGVDDEQVAIYRGVPAAIGPVDLHWVEERTDVTLADLPAFLADGVRDGRPAASLADARNIVQNLRSTVEDDGPGPGPTSSPSPTSSPRLSPTPTASSTA